jgi:hypothetical protein
MNWRWWRCLDCGERVWHFQLPIGGACDNGDPHRWNTVIDDMSRDPHPRVVKLDRWGVYVWIDGGLIACDVAEYDAGRRDECAVDVSAPESQAFLDDVNRALGTSYRFEEFAGR